MKRSMQLGNSTIHGTLEFSYPSESNVTLMLSMSHHWIWLPEYYYGFPYLESSSGWCSTPTLLLICSSFSRENGHPLLICSSLSTVQSWTNAKHHGDISPCNLANQGFPKTVDRNSGACFPRFFWRNDVPGAFLGCFSGNSSSEAGKPHGFGYMASIHQKMLPPSGEKVHKALGSLPTTFTK